MRYTPYPLQPVVASCMPSQDRQTQAVASLISEQFGRPRRILVVGCGSGDEVGILSSALDCDVVGVDRDMWQFTRDGTGPLRLIRGDAQNLHFRDDSFDFVYSYHVLEHIPNPELALSEMRRVLIDGGGYFVGTPNRHRIFGYINLDVSLLEKFRSNCRDFRKRLVGRWQNSLGAHAGFSRVELEKLCGQAFGEVHSVSSRYYEALYPTKARWIRWLNRYHLSSVVFPCVYAMGSLSSDRTLAKLP
jgi:ubiquinone/menaquinone biosynthesis C-methylase UbiE